jgi:beta-phosphoglucomutase-like phosphatase (HAD superfamily)
VRRVLLCVMPHNLNGNVPRLIMLDLLGTMVEHDDAVRSALAASFQAHGERIDTDVASMAIGYPGVMGIHRILKWLHPTEKPHEGSARSIHDLAVKELARLVKFAGAIQPSSGVERLCRTWEQAGMIVATTTTLHQDIVKPLMARLGWDRNPPFSALVLAEEVDHPTPGDGMIRECMTRLGVDEVQQVAKVANSAIGLADAKLAGCGWTVLLDNGLLTMDQMMAIGPTHIVEQFSDLGAIWKLKSSVDVALEDEIARILRGPTRGEMT